MATLRARLLRLGACTAIILELGGAGFTDGNRISDSNGDPEPQATIPLWSPQAFRRYNLLDKPIPEVIPAKPRP